ncbi:MAG: hypothetical protein PHY93_03705 [Bacteriovorax sp.]|nr:hypothetical protein [Bacteriovorax sp.]
MELRKKINEVIDFFDAPLGSQIKYYTLFCFVLWSLHLILISLISYFHLLLNHNIRTIGDWIGDRGWALIIISKVLVFYLALQFIRLKSKKINLVRSYFRNSIQLPRKEVIVSLFFLIIGLMGLGRITLNHTLIFEIDRMLLSVVGTFVFFSVDYALLIVLEIFFPLESVIDKNRKLFLFPLLFYYFTYATFIYEQTVSFRLYAFFFLLLYLGEWRRRNWTLPLLFLLAFIIPSYALLGLDPVWNSSYAFFTVTNVISGFSIFILIGFAIAYLHRTQRNKPEYIYRD